MTKTTAGLSIDTSPAEAQPPIVLALDVGTSSVRAILHDALGRQIRGAESHTPYQMKILADGGVEMDADRTGGDDLPQHRRGPSRRRSHRNWGRGLFDLLAQRAWGGK
jgi:hypothetical protein